MIRKEQQLKNKNKALRKKRSRKSIVAKSKLLRLSVFRSLKHFYMQVIDDSNGTTLCAASDKDIKDVKGKTGIEIASEVGKLLGEKAITKKIEKVVFDRGSFRFHGRVKAAADAAREAGLKF
jgi:large subunit ribosomal protein L18